MNTQCIREPRSEPIWTFLSTIIHPTPSSLVHPPFLMTVNSYIISQDSNVHTLLYRKHFSSLPPPLHLGLIHNPALKLSLDSCFYNANNFIYFSFKGFLQASQCAIFRTLNSQWSSSPWALPNVLALSVHLL